MLDNYKNEIIDSYSRRISTESIGKQYNCSQQTISRFLKKNGINVTRKRSRKNINSNYFDNIDSGIKAYFLGFIAADGSVFKSANGKVTFSLQLQSLDIEILNKLSEELAGDTSLVGNIHTRENGSSTTDVRFSDEIFTSSLIKLGIGFNKTENLDWISLSEEFMRDFIRGYFDGDGSVYISSGKVFGNFVGNKIFLPKLRNYLFENGVLPTKYSIVDRGNFCSFHFGGRGSNRLLYEYMYYDGCFCLERKKIKFECCPL
jgi:intein-encoded DNA endonuclease-like protein